MEFCYIWSLQDAHFKHAPLLVNGGLLIYLVGGWHLKNWICVTRVMQCLRSRKWSSFFFSLLCPGVSVLSLGLFSYVTFKEDFTSSSMTLLVLFCRRPNVVEWKAVIESAAKVIVLLTENLGGHPAVAKLWPPSTWSTPTWQVLFSPAAAPLLNTAWKTKQTAKDKSAVKAEVLIVTCSLLHAVGLWNPLCRSHFYAVFYEWLVLGESASLSKR